MTTHVIETVIFRLIDGADPEVFAKSAEAVSAYVDGCRGFVSRRLSRGEDGAWIDHVEWRDMDSAQAAAAGIAKEPANAPFLRAIDGSSVKMMHTSVAISVN